MNIRHPPKKYVGPHVLEGREVPLRVGLGRHPTATQWTCKYCGARSFDPDKLASQDCNEFESTYPAE